MSVKRSFGLHRYTDVTVGLTGIVQKCRLQKSSELIKDIKSHNRTWKENSRVQPSLRYSFHILAYYYQPFCVQSLASSVSILRHLNCAQWHRHSRSCQGKCPGRNTSALAAALAVKSGISKINQDILTALADATNDLSMSRHQQRTGAATDCTSFGTVSWRQRCGHSGRAVRLFLAESPFYPTCEQNWPMWYVVHVRLYCSSEVRFPRSAMR